MHWLSSFSLADRSGPAGRFLTTMLASFLFHWPERPQRPKLARPLSSNGAGLVMW